AGPALPGCCCPAPEDVAGTNGGRGSESMKPARIGILGVGQIVRNFHLPALLGNARARVVALGNHRIESMQPLADAFAITKTYTDRARMAEDPEIDAVVNALPNSLHAPLTVQMLQRGKHVLCEKPMAISAEEARQMTMTAAAADRTLMIAHVW